MGKLASAELNQRIWNTVMDLEGPEGMLHTPGYPLDRAESGRGLGTYTRSKSFLRSQANTIEGGTSDIMRNILGERVLDLPGEPRVDKGVPWKDIVTWSQAQYYANGRVNYAQGWSMIYFLRTAPAVEKQPRWGEILPLYFETLKERYAAELAELGSARNPLQRGQAGEKARKAALAAAFDGVDLDALHEEWEAFVLGLEVPER